jgi:death-on-curing protein
VSDAVEHLRLEDLLELTRRLGAGPVRDVGLLDSAVARPRSSVFGADAYPTLELKAAALLHSVVNNHALVDGNKRLGWLACVVFLDLDDHETGLDDDGAFALVMAVAAGEQDLSATAAALDVRRLHRP